MSEQGIVYVSPDQMNSLISDLVDKFDLDFEKVAGVVSSHIRLEKPSPPRTEKKKRQESVSTPRLCLIPWQDVKKAYEPYKTFDGTRIRDRMELFNRRYWEKDRKKLEVIEMFLDVAREDDVSSEEYITPEKLKEKFPGLLL